MTELPSFYHAYGSRTLSLVEALRELQPDQTMSHPIGDFTRDAHLRGARTSGMRGVRKGEEDMKHKTVLVDLNELRGLIDDLDLGDTKRNQYLNARWLKYVEWWDSRARQSKWKHLSLRSAVVIGGALIPALVGLREMKVLEPYGWLFAVASIVVSLVIAICAGFESLFGFGDIWREKRTAAEIIKSEGFSFLQLSGKYRDYKSHAEAYQQFTSSVEDLITKEIKDYIVAVTPKKPDNPDNAGAQPKVA